MHPINFFYEEIDFLVEKPVQLKQWIADVVKREGVKLKELNFIFCSDVYLHQINTSYLNHDTYTDIITFDNSDEPGTIEGDIFISIERVRENSQSFQKSFTEELYRVIIHGVLHLIGYNDKTPEEQHAMREKEESSLSLQRFNL